MPQTKHTPWLHADGDKCFLYALDEAGMNRWSAQVTPNNGHDREEAEAVAQLMRAAPDMLEALLLALPHLEAVAFKDNAAYALARGAINKAIVGA